jgi:hypothetical protein
MKYYIASILFILSLYSCSVHKHNYAIRLKNNGDKNIVEVYAESKKGYDISFGSIDSGKWETSTEPKRYPAKDKFIVKWTDSDGKKHVEAVNLKRELKKDFNGVVIFNIDRNNQLTYETKKNPCQYDYDIKIRNSGTSSIYGIRFRKGQARDDFDIREIKELKPKKQARKGGPSKYPPNCTFTISWKSSDNQKYSKTIDLEDQLGSKYKGTLLFCIDENNELSFHTYPPLYSEFFQHLDVFNVFNLFDI